SQSSRGGESGDVGDGARVPARAEPAGRARRAPRAADLHPWRRGVPGRGSRPRDVQPLAAARLSRRRHAAPDREQPGRLHDRSGGRALDALRERSGKGFEVPVLHVNADDPEACIAAIRVAVAYRDQFAKDVLIDLVGYRRFGHNETDEPAFTQPKLYELVRKHPTPRQVWGARLVRDAAATQAEVDAIDKEFLDRITAVYNEMKAAKVAEGNGAKPSPAPTAAAPETPVRGEALDTLNTRLLTWPQGFKAHPRLAKTLERRRDALHSGQIDWGHAEALAFGSVLLDGINI